ncbi:MAG TPA: hypothetical protein ENN09_06945 [Planctomycetes bacterium]|nr:hypothetical protein [Planctomycetota bacterium]
MYKPGRELVDTAMLAPEAADALAPLMKDLLAAAYSPEQLPVEHVISCTNTLGKPLSVEVKWSFLDSVWDIKPASTSTVVQPGGTADIATRIALTETGRRLPYPTASARVITKADGIELSDTEKLLALKFIREAPVRRTAATPVIDGEKEAAWDSAVRIGGFLVEPGTYLANPPTETWVTVTVDRLYVFFKCYERELDKLRTNAQKRDDPVWMDDSVEVFITSPRDERQYYHFLVSAAGVIEDALMKDEKWDGDWEVKTAVHDDGWTAEIGIPAKTLGLKSFSGVKELRVNFCRNRYAGGSAQSSSWNSTYGSFHKPEHFGRLVLKEER